MARTKGKVTEINVPEQDAFATEVAESITHEADRMAEVERSYTQEKLLVSQMIGQASTLRSAAVFFEAGFLLKMREVKENKSYKSLSGNHLILPDGAELEMGTWEAFCRSVGASRAHVDEQLANLNIFGEQALSSMHQMGLGVRDIRKLRKLELTDRDVVIGELEANLDDKDSVVELIEEMASKHAKERDDLAKQLADTEATLEASRRIADEKTSELNRAKEKLSRRENCPDWVEETNELALLVTQISGEVLERLNQLSLLGEQVQEFKLNYPDSEESSAEYLERIYYSSAQMVINDVATYQNNTNIVFGYVGDNARSILQLGKYDPKTHSYAEGSDEDGAAATIN